MSELLFSRMQSYAWALYFAKWLLEEERDHSVSKTEHQMNTRIYNNSFCGLLKNGFPYASVIQDGVSFLNLEMDGFTYQCPSNTVANILRMDLAATTEEVMKSKVSETKESQQKLSASQEGIDDAHQDSPVGENVFEQKNVIKEDKESQCETKYHGDFAHLNLNDQAPLISVTLDDIIFLPPVPKEVVEISSILSAESAASGSETEISPDKPAETSSLEVQQFAAKEYGRFRPKYLSDYQDMQLQKTGREQPDRKHNRGLFFRVSSKRREAGLVQSSIVHGETCEREKVPPSEYTEELPQTGGGRFFQHIHIVMLKKQFGSDALGPYRFIFWPVHIPDITNGKIWADFIVHITEPDGKETVACTDGTYKELTITLDGKEFNIFSTWDNGIFVSYVTLRSKTASIYAISEEIHRKEPYERVDDFFLDQFRYERKGQPKHFVVPFSNNGNEENVPIIGYVEVAQKKYPLVRQEGNTLRYKYAGNEKIIRGYWKNGVFDYSVEDINQF